MPHAPCSTLHAACCMLLFNAPFNMLGTCRSSSRRSRISSISSSSSCCLRPRPLSNLGSGRKVPAIYWAPHIAQKLSNDDHDAAHPAGGLAAWLPDCPASCLLSPASYMDISGHTSWGRGLCKYEHICSWCAARPIEMLNVSWSW